RQHGKHTRQGHTPPLPSTEIKGPTLPIFVTGQANGIQRCNHTSTNFMAAQLHTLRPEGNISKDTALKKLAFGKLKQHADSLAQRTQIYTARSYINPINQDAALSGTQQAIEVLYQRAFARASNADYGNTTATCNLQVDIDQCIFAYSARLIGMKKMLGDNNWFGYQCSSSLASASIVTASRAMGNPASRKRAANTTGSGIARLRARRRSRSVKIVAGVPSRMICPYSITTTRCARAASSKKCVT